MSLCSPEGSWILTQSPTGLLPSDTLRSTAFCRVMEELTERVRQCWVDSAREREGVRRRELLMIHRTLHTLSRGGIGGGAGDDISAMREDTHQPLGL